MADEQASYTDKLDSVLLLLFAGIVFFTAVLFAAEVWFMADSQLFQVVAGILTGFAGALLGRMKPGGPAPQTPQTPQVPQTPQTPQTPQAPPPLVPPQPPPEKESNGT